MKEFSKISPLRILQKSINKELGKGNLGALIARAGVGKTTCLIHIALDRMFKKGKLVHVSMKDTPEKVISHYNVIFQDLFKSFDIADEHEIRALLDKNRIILAYMKASFKLDRLKKNLKNLVEDINFVPDTILVDGFDFEEAEREIFEGFRGIAEEFNTEIWFSALSHRHITEVNERGIPFPCNDFDDFFSIILQINPTKEGLFLRLLKDHEGERVTDFSVRIDPRNYFVVN